MKAILLSILGLIVLASCNQPYLRVSKLNDNTIIIANVKSDLKKLYKTGDTVMIFHKINPEVCDNCIPTNDTDTTVIYKAIVR